MKRSTSRDLSQGMMIFLCLSALQVGCSHKKVIKTEARTSEKGVLTMWSSWVKDKNSKYDIRVNVTNDNSQGIIFLLGEMHCFRGNSEGLLKHTFFNTGERTINFAPSQTKTFNMACDLQEKGAKGDFRITVNSVYANPSGDGRTQGKILAHNIELRIPEGSKD